MDYSFDTICATATPLSLGSIGVIRISGEYAFRIVEKIFSKKITPKMINHGWIVDQGKKIDEVIVLPFVAPHSYTGENVAEIQTHGSPVVMNEILNLVLKNGARLAQRGEFTKRAFLNHKIDLSQAEAVLDLINAKTSLYVRALTFPIIINFLLYFINVAIYSLNKLKGGFVTTISHSFSISRHSGLLKSPFCFNGVLTTSGIIFNCPFDKGSCLLISNL